MTTEDLVGSTWRYAFHLKIPEDYAEFSPKQTLGQWHNGSYDSVFNRYEEGDFTICLNNRRRACSRRPRSPSPRCLNTFSYTFTWHATAGALTASVNGRTVLKETGLALVPSATTSVYFKYGIYRNMQAGLVGRISR